MQEIHTYLSDRSLSKFVPMFRKPIRRLFIPNICLRFAHKEALALFMFILGRFAPLALGYSGPQWSSTLVLMKKPDFLYDKLLLRAISRFVQGKTDGFPHH